MANVLSKLYISELRYPVDGYTHNVQIVRSVDGGDKFYYCGCGAYCKSLEAAEKYADSVKEKENVIEVLYEPLIF